MKSLKPVKPVDRCSIDLVIITIIIAAAIIIIIIIILSLWASACVFWFNQHICIISVSAVDVEPIILVILPESPCLVVNITIDVVWNKVSWPTDPTCHWNVCNSMCKKFQGGLKLLTLLTSPPECWNCRPVPIMPSFCGKERWNPAAHMSPASSLPTELCPQHRL